MGARPACQALFLSRRVCGAAAHSAVFGRNRFAFVVVFCRLNVADQGKVNAVSLHGVEQHVGGHIKGRQNADVGVRIDNHRTAITLLFSFIIAGYCNCVHFFLGFRAFFSIAEGVRSNWVTQKSEPEKNRKKMEVSLLFSFDLFDNPTAIC